MNPLKDKYILLAIAVMLVIGLVCLTETGSLENDDAITGIVSNVKETDNGNTFFLTDTSGKIMKCYSSNVVNDGDVCSVKGTMSDDGNIFFISELTAR